VTYSDSIYIIPSNTSPIHSIYPFCPPPFPSPASPSPSAPDSPPSLWLSLTSECDSDGKDETPAVTHPLRTWGSRGAGCIPGTCFLLIISPPSRTCLCRRAVTCAHSCRCCDCARVRACVCVCGAVLRAPRPGHPSHVRRLKRARDGRRSLGGGGRRGQMETAKQAMTIGC
jgi:hypothetical protein